jgi:hypothetical protein
VGRRRRRRRRLDCCRALTPGRSRRPWSELCVRRYWSVPKMALGSVDRDHVASAERHGHAGAGAPGPWPHRSREGRADSSSIGRRCCPGTRVGVTVTVAGGGRAGTRRHRHADVHEAVGTVVAAPCGRCRRRSGSGRSWSTSISERYSRSPGHNDLRAPPTTRISSATEVRRKSLENGRSSRPWPST